MSFAKFLRTPFLQNTFGRLLATLDENFNAKFCTRRHHYLLLRLLHDFFEGLRDIRALEQRRIKNVKHEKKKFVEISNGLKMRSIPKIVSQKDLALGLLYLLQ